MRFVGLYDFVSIIYYTIRGLLCEMETPVLVKGQQRHSDRDDGGDFLQHMVEDETWCHHFQLEWKSVSLQWKHPDSPRSNKFKYQKSAREIRDCEPMGRDRILWARHRSKMKRYYYKKLQVLPKLEKNIKDLDAQEKRSEGTVFAEFISVIDSLIKEFPARLSQFK
ncbi:hypothetical protein TNCV_3888331 [Trichonephila clavipes]|nr:hypothetical protein TNCV_3888331 [Trichonephila clavipes]